MNAFANTAVLGAGVIGASWTALFLASGRNVAVFDPSETVETSVRDYVDMAWPTLEELGLVKAGAPGRVSFHKTAAEAVEGADFVQESVPERIAVKHALYAGIEPALKPEAIIASSASGLTLSEMQAGWKNPARFFLGHPFNPPHLIPLVEVMGNAKTETGVITAAASTAGGTIWAACTSTKSSPPSWSSVFWRKQGQRACKNSPPNAMR